MNRKTIKRNRAIRKYTYLGCPMTKNRSPWCFRMCPPDKDGRGRCGRVAPHSFKGHLQQSIIDYEKRQLKKKSVKLVKRTRKLPQQTYLGCPMTKNRSPWCFRMCPPDKEGRGRCGRIAPHSFKGHLQQSIVDYDTRKKEGGGE